MHSAWCVAPTSYCGHHGHGLWSGGSYSTCTLARFVLPTSLSEPEPIAQNNVKVLAQRGKASVVATHGRVNKVPPPVEFGSATYIQVAQHCFTALPASTPFT
eukprot:scaffold2191_cov92-Skeletonema_marinoi.AAC.7